MRHPPLDWNDALFQVIDLRTFSSIWYWLSVAVTWSTLSHWIIGVPFDMIMRARRQGPEAEHDLEQLVDINIRRLMGITDIAGLWLIGVVSFVLTSLAAMGFYYGLELAQGLFCLALPASVVGAMGLYKSRQLQAMQPKGTELARQLLRHRFQIQVIAMLSIFVTAMYGMYHNLSVLPLI